MPKGRFIVRRPGVNPGTNKYKKDDFGLQLFFICKRETTVTISKDCCRDEWRYFVMKTSHAVASPQEALTE